MIQNTVTMIGNLVAEPVLRRTSTDRPVVNARIAVNEQRADGNENTTYMNIVIWGNMALNFVESVSVGDRVICIGKLQIRKYENAGATQYRTELVAQEIGASHLWALAKPVRPTDAYESRVDEREPVDAF